MLLVPVDNPIPTSLRKMLNTIFNDVSVVIHSWFRANALVPCWLDSVRVLRDRYIYIHRYVYNLSGEQNVAVVVRKYTGCLQPFR